MAKGSGAAKGLGKVKIPPNLKGIDGIKNIDNLDNIKGFDNLSDGVKVKLENKFKKFDDPKVKMNLTKSEFDELGKTELKNTIRPSDIKTTELKKLTKTDMKRLNIDSPGEFKQIISAGKMEDFINSGRKLTPKQTSDFIDLLKKDPDAAKKIKDVDTAKLFESKSIPKKAWELIKKHKSVLTKVGISLFGAAIIYILYEDDVNNLKDCAENDLDCVTNTIESGLEEAQRLAEGGFNMGKNFFDDIIDALTEFWYIFLAFVVGLVIIIIFINYFSKPSPPRYS